jgi:hypothetical protein
LADRERHFTGLDASTPMINSPLHSPAVNNAISPTKPHPHAQIQLKLSFSSSKSLCFVSRPLFESFSAK